MLWHSLMSHLMVHRLQLHVQFANLTECCLDELSNSCRKSLAAVTVCALVQVSCRTPCGLEAEAMKQTIQACVDFLHE